MIWKMKANSLIWHAMGIVLICIAINGFAAEGGLNKGRSLYDVGHQIIDLPYQQGGEQQTLTIAVWYPTSSAPKPFKYAGPTRGNVALNGKPLTVNGPYPLLVFSHGYGGSGYNAIFLAEKLAAQGWIVACPDHHDKYSTFRIHTGRTTVLNRLNMVKDAKKIAASGPDNRSLYLYRIKEMKLALDGMLSSDLFGKVIDQQRIAVGGHSFGGYTALGVSGTLKDYYDPRIKAILLFSTGAGGYLYRENELKSVKIPSMLLMGEEEQEELRGETTMAEISAKIFNSLSSPKYFLVIKGADHFSFDNRLTNNFMAKRMSGTEEEFDLIRHYSIAFLEKFVAGKTGYDDILKKSNPGLTKFLAE